MINLTKKLHFAPGIKFIFIVLFLCLLLFARYIFGGYVYLFTDIGSDTVDIYFPYFYFNTRLLHDAFSWYTFNMGVGLSSLNVNYYLFDPFSYILYLFPKESLSTGIVYTIILKLLFTAWFSYKYFKEILPEMEEFIVWIGAIAITFCGFFILWGQHFFFSSAMAIFPLLLYGFELLLKHKQKWVFILAIALLAMDLFFFYQVIVFFTFYVLFRILVTKRIDSLKGKFLFIVKWVIPFSIIGVALVSFRVFPAFYELITNPRITVGSSRWFNYLFLSSPEYIGNSFLRLFSNNFWGCGERYFGFLNYYESPQLYSSLLILLLAPQAFFIRDKRKLFIVGSLSLFLVLLFITPYLAYVFNGLQYPSYRWGMLFSFSLVLLGVMGLISYTQCVTRLKKIVLILTPLIYVGLILIVTSQLKHSNFLPQTIRVILFFILYLMILLFFSKKSKWFYPFLFIVFLFDIAVEHYPTINHRRVLKNNFEETGQSYFDGTIEVVDSIGIKDPSFYRMIKSYYSKFLNDSFIQGYNGVTYYNSISDPSYINFLRKNHVPFFLPENVSYIGLFGERPILYDLLSVKYCLTNQYSGKNNLFYSNSGKSKYGYRRPNALPFGFTYDSYITEDNITDFNDEFLLKALILNKAPDIDLKECNEWEVDKDYFIDDEIVKVDLSDFILMNLKPLSKGEMESSNNDPMMVYPNFNFPSHCKCRIECDLYTDRTGSSQLFWRSLPNGFSEENSLTIKLKTGKNHLVFESKELNEISSKIDEIRIDPVDYTGSFKLENLTIVFYNDQVSVKKEGIPINSVQYLNINRFEGSLPNFLKVEANNIDPQLLFSIPQTESDTTTIYISFNLKTDKDSYCQLFWDNNQTGFTEMNSIKINYAGGKRSNRLRFKIRSGLINQLRLDPGDKAITYELSDLKIDRLSSRQYSDVNLYSSLRKDTLTITSFESDHIKGNIKVEKNKLLFLSVPYNKGWTITCNGRKIVPLVADYGFMALPLKQGEYSIEMEFFPYPMKAGITVSLITILLLLIGWLFNLRRENWNGNNGD